MAREDHHSPNLLREGATTGLFHAFAQNVKLHCLVHVRPMPSILTENVWLMAVVLSRLLCLLCEFGGHILPEPLSSCEAASPRDEAVLIQL